MKKYVFEWGKCTFISRKSCTLNLYKDAEETAQQRAEEYDGAAFVRRTVTAHSHRCAVIDQNTGEVLYDIEIVDGIHGWLRNAKQKIIVPRRIACGAPARD